MSSLQKTSFGKKPVFLLITLRASATVAPSPSTSIYTVFSPFSEGWGTATCAVTLTPPSVRSMPAPMMTAVLRMSTSPKSFVKNRNAMAVMASA